MAQGVLPIGADFRILGAWRSGKTLTRLRCRARRRLQGARRFPPKCAGNSPAARPAPGGTEGRSPSPETERGTKCQGSRRREFPCWEHARTRGDASLEFLGGVVATAVIGGIFYVLSVRGLSKEVASLRQDNANLRATLPGTVIDALVGHGFIPQNREPEARSFVAERFLPPGGVRRAVFGHADNLTEGFRFPPTE